MNVQQRRYFVNPSRVCKKSSPKLHYTIMKYGRKYCNIYHYNTPCVGVQELKSVIIQRFVGQPVSFCTLSVLNNQKKNRKPFHDWKQYLETMSSFNIFFFLLPANMSIFQKNFWSCLFRDQINLTLRSTGFFLVAW